MNARGTVLVDSESGEPEFESCDAAWIAPSAVSATVEGRRGRLGSEARAPSQPRLIAEPSSDVSSVPYGVGRFGQTAAMLEGCAGASR
jgi:hypothetical protein